VGGFRPCPIGAVRSEEPFRLCKTTAVQVPQYGCYLGPSVIAKHDIERVYREEGARLYHGLLGFTGDPETARDAMAEAFARAMVVAESINALVPWLRKVAFRVAGEELRHPGRLRRPIDSEVAALSQSPDLPSVRSVAFGVAWRRTSVRNGRPWPNISSVPSKRLVGP
jgi:hypothetical protein